MTVTPLRLMALILMLSACGEPVTRDSTARILLMGDSLMASHKLTGQSVSHALEKELGTQVTDRSVIGARMIYVLPISGSAGLNIPKQYHDGDWDWIIVNGGGNDIWFGCGCAVCNRRIDRLISDDGRSGVIPGLLSRLRATGAQVIYVGYLRTPGVNSPIEGCADEGDKMDARMARLAELDGGLHFLSLADMVPPGDRSHHAIDLIHPSVKGSAAIADRIAGIIRRNDPAHD